MLNLFPAPAPLDATLFPDVLDSRYGDGTDWLMLAPFQFIDPIEGIITVPFVERSGQRLGYVTDFASIPRAAWPVIGAPAQYAKEAVIHDYLYTTQSFERERCDAVFYRALLANGRSQARATAMTLAVRAGGWHAWNKRQGNVGNILDTDFWDLADPFTPDAIRRRWPA